ncbi:MAG: hypothetical protein EOO13_12180 [Chitinophagaceae bacterium]|nr:MAG: hypothetical protein EOO13_12180 [Chitinophagaceae bacterium]
MIKILLPLGLLLMCSYLQAQDSSRSIKAIRTNLPIKVDGILNEEAWKQAPLFDKFVEMRPTYNKPEQDNSRTEAWILYDNDAVYFSGICYEPSKDSISSELVGRDVVGVNDFIGILFDSYQDRINGVGFYVTALGEQFDAKYSLGEEDGSWNAVYQTATKINASNWTFEMRIPYAALRFSKKPIQDWGININRKRNKSGKQVSWNPINPNKFGLMNQAGNFVGLENIKPPIRLSFSPYLSAYGNSYPTLDGKHNKDGSFNGGMDVKYGLTKAFTLDMTLIPDFGQVQSDNKVLNLSPFEVKFNENRSFFTEGTELFNKGNFFYSRRIGGEPINYYGVDSRLQARDSIVKNPGETKLINATKISGRTANGLGIGIFNAITQAQHASIYNDSTDTLYRIETSPLSNYNIIVLDQTMKNNSSVTLINTSVLRAGKTYDANVTAAMFDLYDKKVDWNIWGRLANSRLTGMGKVQSGLLYELNLGKFRGPFNFEVHHYLADEQYQQNDLGYFTNNNYFLSGISMWYKVNKPKWFYNNININFRSNYSEQYIPRRYQSFETSLNANSQLKSLWVVGVNSFYDQQAQDFYEPRIYGRMFKRPAIGGAGFFINSNRAKKYSAELEYNYSGSKKYGNNNHAFMLANQFRFNQKLTLGVSSFNEFKHNDLGFATTNNAGDSSFFGLRKLTTSENVLSVKYNFNIKMGITFRARHYWRKVDYREFFLLQQDGYLAGNPNVPRNPENNVNIFNIDMVYTWQFALGSFINIGWKNAGYSASNDVRTAYSKNLRNTLDEPKENNFSIKVIYFLDYLDLKNTKKKNQVKN